MKRLLPVLVCCLARVVAAGVASAQVAPTAQSNDANDYQPQNVNVKSDGRCMTVRPGDTVHYTLTIEGVAGAQTVFGDLRLRFGHTHEFTGDGGLPVPDFRSLGGGGLGAHDASEGKVYHFAFKVPREIYGGTYRGVQVTVRADQPELAVYQPSYGLTGDGSKHDRAPRVDVTRRARDEVHAYCLNVISNFGSRNASPAVTDFQPGQVDPLAASATPAAPAPMAPPPPSPQPLQPPPQPR